MRLSRRTVHRLAAAGIAAAVLVPLVIARAGGVEVEHPWTRVAMKGRNGAVFMTIRDATGEGDALVAAHSDVADTVELHTHVMEDGVMKMRPVPRIEVPAGGTVELKPGGYHVMLIGLRRDLKLGERVPLELVFEKAGTFQVEAEVKEAGAMGMSYGDMEHRHQGTEHGEMKHGGMKHGGE